MHFVQLLLTALKLFSRNNVIVHTRTQEDNFFMYRTFFMKTFKMESCKTCKNNDHTHLFHCINICRVPQKIFKHSVCGLMFKYIMKTCLFKYTENFTTKNENFQIKKSDIFHVSAQNIDCWYTLEPPRCGGSTHSVCLWAGIRKIIYTPVNPSFTI